MDTFLVLGGGAGIAAIIVAFLVATSGRRLAWIAVVGAVLSLAWLVVATTIFDEGCDENAGDCYGDAIALFIAAANFAGWLAGTLVGAGLRRLVMREPAADSN